MPVRAGMLAADMPHLNYMPQVSQLVALQLEHGDPEPATGEVKPLSSLEKQAKEDSFRSAISWQLGQGASLSA